MKRKPWSLIILAVGHMLAPLGNQFFNAVFSNMSVPYYLMVAFQWHNIEKNWVQWVFPIIAGCAIYICKRWSFFIYLTSMASLFISSYLGYRERVGVDLGYELFAVYALNILFVGYFLVPAVREIYFNPRLRWWEVDLRFRADLPAKFTSHGQSYQGEIGNISISGLFLKAKQLPDDKETININFNFADHEYLFSGDVIRHANQDSIGFGVKFFHHDGSRKAAKLLASALMADNRLLSNRLASKEDSFGFWIKRLITTGKGFLPEKNPGKKS